MKTLWMEISDAINPGQYMGFAISGVDVSRRCLACGALFSQTEEGHLAFKQHGFTEHEDILAYDWRELHGVKVTIGVVERPDEPSFDGTPQSQIELVAMTEDGTIYFLPFSYYAQEERGGFKWKPKSREHNLLKLMQGEVASPSNG